MRSNGHWRLSFSAFRRRDRSAIDDVSLKVDPAARGVSHPLQVEHRPVPRAGVDAQDDESREVPIDLIVVALAVPVPPKGSGNQCGGFRSC